MSGTTKATIIFSLIAFVLYATLAYIQAGLCNLISAALLSLSVGYVGAQLDQPDASKAARIAREGAKAGLLMGCAGMIGQFVGGWVTAEVALWFLATTSCLSVFTLGVATFFGWLGGFSWARQNYERQSGHYRM